MRNKCLLILSLPVVCLLMTFQSLHGNNFEPEPEIDIESLETKADFEQAYDILKTRVDQLKSDKKVAATKAEKQLVKKQIKETRMEIDAIKAKALSGGIYIGSGALVLIILLLILL